MPNASSGCGAISKNEDGQRCVVAEKSVSIKDISLAFHEFTVPSASYIALRILRISDATERAPTDHKFVVGKGGYRIEASRNMFSGSGLKYDNILTDVLWGRKSR